MHAGNKKLSILFLRFGGSDDEVVKQLLSKLFQFSFWDSFGDIAEAEEEDHNLSILFLRFKDVLRRYLLYSALQLSILFLRFIYNSLDDDLGEITRFQFSFWDSWPPPLRGTYAKK